MRGWTKVINKVKLTELGFCFCGGEGYTDESCVSRFSNGNVYNCLDLSCNLPQSGIQINGTTTVSFLDKTSCSQLVGLPVTSMSVRGH